MEQRQQGGRGIAADAATNRLMRTSENLRSDTQSTRRLTGRITLIKPSVKPNSELTENEFLENYLKPDKT